MKKFITITLVTLASLFTIAVASSFVASVSENSVCIESVDGTSLNLNLGSVQVTGMYDILPVQYKKMLDDSYGRFRERTLAAGYDKAINVDGFKLVCSKDENGDVYTISGNVEGFGYHKVKVHVGSRDNFISWMDSIILK